MNIINKSHKKVLTFSSLCIDEIDWSDDSNRFEILLVTAFGKPNANKRSIKDTGGNQTQQPRQSHIDPNWSNLRWYSIQFKSSIAMASVHWNPARSINRLVSVVHLAASLLDSVVSLTECYQHVSYKDIDWFITSHCRYQ